MTVRQVMEGRKRQGRVIGQKGEEFGKSEVEQKKRTEDTNLRLLLLCPSQIRTDHPQTSCRSRAHSFVGRNIPKRERKKTKLRERGEKRKKGNWRKLMLRGEK